MPIVEVAADEIVVDEQEVGPRDATRFRATGARANFLAQDRPDMQYAAKEIYREMSKPKESSQEKLKRLARYLLEFPRLVWEYREWTIQPDNFKVFGDSDWAGCVRTRKSTSGGVVTLGDVAIKSWSSTQSTPALSSGEAEYYSLVKSAAEALGVQALALDLGWSFGLDLFVDATAAQGIAARTGLGRVRHMETRVLWVQQALREGKFRIRRVDGKKNPSDILTKPLSAEFMRPLLMLIGGAFGEEGT